MRGIVWGKGLAQVEGVEEATTDAHGVFVFEDLEPGRRNVLCKKDTFQNLSFIAEEVLAGEETEVEGQMIRA